MLNDLPLDIVYSIVTFLPIFDTHNFWQTTRTLASTKSQLKEHYARDNNYSTYQDLRDFYLSLKVFSSVDVLDTTYTWSEANIVGHQINKGAIYLKVRYLGYSTRWNEWIQADSGRIAKYGTLCYNGTNGDPTTNDRVIYYNRGRWREYRFVELTQDPTPQIVLQHKGTTPPIILPYIKAYIAPISRRGILLLDQ